MGSNGPPSRESPLRAFLLARPRHKKCLAGKSERAGGDCARASVGGRLTGVSLKSRIVKPEIVALDHTDIADRLDVASIPRILAFGRNCNVTVGAVPVDAVLAGVHGYGIEPASSVPHLEVAGLGNLPDTAALRHGGWRAGLARTVCPARPPLFVSAARRMQNLVDSDCGRDCCAGRRS